VVSCSEPSQLNDSQWAARIRRLLWRRVGGPLGMRILGQPGNPLAPERRPARWGDSGGPQRHLRPCQRAAP